MSRCICGRETLPNRKTRSTLPWTTPETLRIQYGREKPATMVPGTSRLYCYWKIKIHIDFANMDLELHVPPEWRMIERHRLSDWIKQLRENPFEDITLGQTPYKWMFDILIPTGQNFMTVPLHGQDGWPRMVEPVPYWNTPKLRLSNGTNLPIGLNRPPYIANPNMEKIVCYWPIELPASGNREAKTLRVWVPPEWRKLTKRARKNWMNKLSLHKYQMIELGGVAYQWHDNVILPLGQNQWAIEYVGQGQYQHIEVDNESPGNDERETPPKRRFNKFSRDSPSNLLSGNETSNSSEHPSTPIPSNIPLPPIEEIIPITSSSSTINVNSCLSPISLSPLPPGVRKRKRESDTTILPKLNLVSEVSTPEDQEVAAILENLLGNWDTTLEPTTPYAISISALEERLQIIPCNPSPPSDPPRQG